MLDTLGRRDETGVEGFGVEVIFHDLASLLEKTFHSIAAFALGAFVERLKDLFETGDVVFGLVEVHFEALA